MSRVLAIAVALVAGCSHSPRVSLAQPTGEISSKEYVDMLKRWTRHGSTISDFDASLMVDATMHSPEFRAAFAEKWIEVYKLAPDEAARKRVELNGAIANVWEFHFNTSGHTWEVNELLPSKKQWVLQLLDDKGRAVESSFVKQVRDRIEIEQAFYPQANIFTRAWTVQFPRNLPDGTPLVTADTRSLTLRIAGPKGDMDLIWKLQ
jgi:hypothetical protein